MRLPNPLDAYRSEHYIPRVPYSPLALANAFISRYGAIGRLDQMKLQKLDFYAYGWWLAYNAQPILTEGPQVWRYGPVFSSLYSALRPFGGSAITVPVGQFSQAPPIIVNDGSVESQWVDWIWNRYGHLSATQLSAMTHEQGSPWQTEAEAQNYCVPDHHPIPDDTIRAYFERLATNLR